MMRALLLSEDLDWGKMFQVIFSNWGHDCVQVEIVTQLIDKLENTKFDLVILEGIQSIQTDDWQVISRYFSRQKDRVPVITFSWFMNDKMRNYCDQLNVVKSLIYPCDIAKEIATVIEKLFGEKVKWPL